MKRILLTESITSLLILLFVFIATSKIYEQDAFRFVFTTSPLINSVLSVVAWGLWSSLIVTLLFTLYISYMLAFASHHPLSYGGVFKTLKWNHQLIFNVVFTVLALCGLWLHRREPFSKNRITHAVITP